MNRFHAISGGHWTRIGPKSIRVNAGQGRSNASSGVAVEIVGRSILLTTPGASEAGSKRGTASAATEHRTRRRSSWCAEPGALAQFNAGSDFESQKRQCGTDAFAARVGVPLKTLAKLMCSRAAMLPVFSALSPHDDYQCFPDEIFQALPCPRLIPSRAATRRSAK
jgi:hypothetical protein